MIWQGGLGRYHGLEKTIFGGLFEGGRDAKTHCFYVAHNKIAFCVSNYDISFSEMQGYAVSNRGQIGLD